MDQSESFGGSPGAPDVGGASADLEGVDVDAVHQSVSYGPLGTVALFWEGGEHSFLGNQAILSFPPPSQPGTVVAASHPLMLPNGLLLTYGQIVALAGDFYGVLGQAISEDPSGATFRAAFESLAVAASAKGEATSILSVMATEIRAVDRAIKSGTEPSLAYAQLGDSLSTQWAMITGLRYLRLALTNWDHFGAAAVTSYSVGHTYALGLAAAAAAVTDANQRKRQLELAYAANAFADHFLTDLFSAGHLRVPRKEITEYAGWIAGGQLARYMHDEDCCFGLTVTDAHGNSWKAYGDKKLRDTGNEVNLGRCEQAVQRSVDEVWAAFTTKAAQPEPFGALALIPDINALVANPANTTNRSPLYVLANGRVARRTRPADTGCYAWKPGFAWPGLGASHADLTECNGPNRFRFEPVLLEVVADSSDDVELAQCGPSGPDWVFTSLGNASLPIAADALRHSPFMRCVGDVDGDGLGELVIGSEFPPGSPRRLDVFHVGVSGTPTPTAATVGTVPADVQLTVADPGEEGMGRIVEVAHAAPSAPFSLTAYGVTGSSIQAVQSLPDIGITPATVASWRLLTVNAGADDRDRIAVVRVDATNTTMSVALFGADETGTYTKTSDVGSSRVDLQACKLEYSIVSPK